MDNIKICQKCGCEFHKKYSVSRNYWATQRYCSRNCAASVTSRRPRPELRHALDEHRFHGSGPDSPSWKGGPVTLACLECGKFFTVKRYRLNDGAKFCSRECAFRHRDKGKTVLHERQRKSAAYKAWRTLVFERDNYTCRECGQRGGYLHADHIKPFAYSPELRFDVTNGRTLCVPCHKKTPTFGIQGVRIARQAASQVAP